MIQHETINKLALLLTERKFEVMAYRLGVNADKVKKLKEIAYIRKVTTQAIRNLEFVSCLMIASNHPEICQEVYGVYEKYHKHVPRYVKRALKNKKGE